MSSIRKCSTACQQKAFQQRCYVVASAISLLVIIVAGKVLRGEAATKPGRIAGLAARLFPKGCFGNKPLNKGIPKIFHQTYKNYRLPVAYRKYVAKCRNLNPDWLYVLWRDEDIEAFVSDRFPQYVRKYRTFATNLQRSDLIRYMVLYHYGGVYLDMDVECLAPFFPSLEGHAAFLDQERREHARILYGREFTAMNSAMGSVPGHPFYLRMLESIDAADDSLREAGNSTGPDRLTRVYEEWTRACPGGQPVTLLDPVVFSPSVDTAHNFHERCSGKCETGGMAGSHSGLALAR